ncbi:hypothetical protein NDU88_006884 [Pleurodeles waltl]|uniref:Uncharacterized protein n=1 Tax=Pleurodeles waltl TaxID=8319 RepID=A0AAV7LQF9_PLEWA|nr:hypothetical protein NDU88_006884 [Pleurodeles waltl]
MLSLLYAQAKASLAITSPLHDPPSPPLSISRALRASSRRAAQTRLHPWLRRGEETGHVMPGRRGGPRSVRQRGEGSRRAEAARSRNPYSGVFADKTFSHWGPEVTQIRQHPGKARWPQRIAEEAVGARGARC